MGQDVSPNVDLVKEIYSLELKVIHAVKDMEDHGCRVDIPFLKDLQAKLEKEIADLEKEAAAIDPALNIGSPAQLVAWLISNKVEVPEKTGDKPEVKEEQGRGIDLWEGILESDDKAPRYTVDSKVLKKMEHPIVRIVEKYRKALKFKSTYVDAILDSQINEIIHPDFRTIQARTGRLSCTRPSLQTIPNDPEDLTEEEKKELVSIRKAFIPREGCRLFPIDYAQQEYRLFVHYTNNPRLIELYKKDNVDFHIIVASLINGVPEKEVTKAQRKKAKTENFAILYGAGAEKLSQTLGCTVTEAKALMKKYFENIKGAEFLIGNTKEVAFRNGFVKTLFGRMRYLHYRDRNGKEVNETHKALNTIIQGSAADIMKIMLVKINNFLKRREGVDFDYPYGVRCILTIHDEIILEVPFGQEGIVYNVKNIMEYLPMVKVPMVADVSVCDANWGSKRKVDNAELEAWSKVPLKLINNNQADPYKILPFKQYDFVPKVGLWKVK